MRILACRARAPCAAHRNRGNRRRRYVANAVRRHDRKFAQNVGKCRLLYAVGQVIKWSSAPGGPILMRVLRVPLVLCAALLAACGNGLSVTAPVAAPVSSPGVPSLSVQPANQNVTVGQTATFS